MPTSARSLTAKRPEHNSRTCWRARYNSGVPEPASFEGFAIAAPGLEPIVAAELATLRARAARVVDGGVEFRGDHRLLYAANLHLRVASRVIVRIGRFRAASFAELERRARKVPWEQVLPKGAHVRMRVTCRKSRLYHSDGVAQRLYEAAAHRVGAVPATRSGIGTSVMEQPPDDDAGAAQLFVVRLDRDECTISADSSGAHLHQRGYRTAVAEAPLRETLAAALVLASGWDRKTPLLDPFCGSGTIPIEAALLARRIAPGKRRTFRFADWPDFDRSVWQRVWTRALESELPTAGVVIAGSDRSGAALRAAIANAERAGVSADVRFRRADVADVPPPGHTPGWIVSNPPYGVRLGERDELRRLYAGLGRALRERFGAWHVGILSTDRRLDTQLRVPMLERLQTTNGGLRVHYLVGIVPAGRLGKLGSDSIYGENGV
jgi:putative N6-adenine-specific DNA methylase